MAGDQLKDTEKKTAFNPLKQPLRVGDFRITTMKLTSANLDVGSGGAEFLDLTTSVWHELNFYEDIYSPIVSGDITLTDTVGLIESFPIIGEEILDVSFSTAGAVLPPTAGPSAVGGAPPISEAPKQIMNRFRVYKVDPPVQVTDNSRTIKLYFVTDNQFTNLLSKVRKIIQHLKIFCLQEHPVMIKPILLQMQQEIYFMIFSLKTKNHIDNPKQENHF